ncbi:RluA family pseudouridine synthase [Candidatus Uhrbacteria bacterium]|nr:RluA family pseudouridine synthase [Candidatus Uhrbacteria bacterium]
MKIVYEDHDVIVVEKPAGLIVHGGPGIKEKTLADELLILYPEIKDVGESPERPGIVHRLDKETSGLMLIAKNQKSFDNLKKQFAERGIEKEYLALLYGKLRDEAGRITFKIGRSRKGGRMAARPESQEGRDAVTEYEVIKLFVNATLVKVKILTGRTHQVRAHFHAFGHPVVGDPLYKIKRMKIRHAPPRLFLHAAKIGFTDLGGNYREFASPLPKELEDYLGKLKFEAPSPKKS